ncbi:P-loop containing nucleoside triphosphate hydrolase [Ostreococcus tauri]|uniref:P-loop containing nucleoside triphosphate hydrolase n=1 Tax=Ostreococcus tauri TaxID=70448 RepID=A0A090M5K1_OSTTA|nr:P-loop containing nucleoside triphosphate hydrolase [Ostreococcus tauri]CEF99525.1 P-loop containing nucleoside triphosphate hydrolase [Ostreococcus tauri]|eukprot:XP_003081834.2 P-loop containing nucleoside triphosphate hydrolase [Ostreococcus tauri]
MDRCRAFGSRVKDVNEKRGKVISRVGWTRLALATRSRHGRSLPIDRRVVRAAPVVKASELETTMERRGTTRVRELSNAHEGVERWIVFSDLHVSKRTMETCREVLRRVSEEARAMKAGVVFLGDFWHARGAIPVEPLNEALQLMSSANWTAPTIMIPGNHDQVTAGGMSHALTPLAKANANIVVFDGPTLYGGALWLPYRRNADELKRAIQETKGEFNAIFCHADVIGASMNETFQARDGLDPALFGGANTYTGHYHKPHVVPNTNITYVGSPYEVSRSEAGQKKELIVLDARTWVEGSNTRVELNIGPKHFAVEGLDAGVPTSARAGDIIRWTLPIEILDSVSDATPSAIRKARDDGFIVEVCYTAKELAARIPKAEELGPTGLFDAYAVASNMTPSVNDFGREVLREVASADDAPETRRAAKGVSVSFAAVELEGFGTFQSTTRYALGSRGVCVVIGENRTDTCSDSNGAGKTTLVMSPMWALTGQSDLRIDGAGSGKSLTKSDVVNDSTKFGRVRLEGHLNNGVPFWVERKVNRTKLVSLKYGINGEEKTMAESKLTQQGINDDLGADVIANTTFHGQHTVGALLDANDATLKAALGKLVEADTWTKAKDISRKRVSEIKGTMSAISAEVKAREDYIARTRSRRDQALRESESWEQQRRRRVSELEASSSAASRTFTHFLSMTNHFLQRLQRVGEALEVTSSQAEGVIDLSRNNSANAAKMFEVKESELEHKMGVIEGEIERLNAAVREWQAKEASAGAVGRQCHTAVGMFVGADGGAHSHPNGVGTCDRCLQPIDPTHHKQTLIKLKDEARKAALEHGQTIKELERAVEALNRAMEGRRKLYDDAALARKAERTRVESSATAASNATDQLRQAQRSLSIVGAAVSRAEMLLNSAPEDAVREALTMSLDDAFTAPAALSTPKDSPSKILAGMNPDLMGVTSSTQSSATKTMIVDAERMNVNDVEFVRRLVKSAEDIIVDGERAAREASRRLQELNEFASTAHTNPHASALEELDAQLASESASLETRVEALNETSELLAVAQAADAAFGTKGIQSYLFEGALGDLSARVRQYMDALTGGALSLELRPAGAGFAADVDETSDETDDSDADDDSEKKKTRRRKKAPEPPSASAAERIERVIHARRHDGVMVPRSLRQLSGGERRRAALALALAYADLASERCGVACDTLVLDEVVQHLDAEGISRVTSLLRALPKKTVLLTSQADSSTAHLFDVVDKVVKGVQGSSVAIASGADVDWEEELNASERA